jgi:hypothetical protein
MRSTFEPYNKHFLQDIGAFQIGLGMVLFLAGGARSTRWLRVALGRCAGGVPHRLAHRGQRPGGIPQTDIPTFAFRGWRLSSCAPDSRVPVTA